MNDAKSWAINHQNQIISHYSGLLLQIEGDMIDPEGIIPIDIPKSLSPKEVACLIREGVEICRGGVIPCKSYRKVNRFLKAVH